MRLRSYSQGKGVQQAAEILAADQWPARPQPEPPLISASQALRDLLLLPGTWEDHSNSLVGRWPEQGTY